MDPYLIELLKWAEGQVQEGVSVEAINKELAAATDGKANLDVLRHVAAATQNAAMQEAGQAGPPLPLPLAGVASGPAPVQQPQVGNFESFLRGGADTATFGFADEIVARLRSLSPNIEYGPEVEAIRQRQAAAQQANPIAFGGGQVAGAVLPALATGGTSLGGRLGVTGARLAGRGVGGRILAAGGKGALAGGAEAGIYGAGSAEGGARERAASGLRAVPVGLAAGGAIGAGLTGLGNAAGSLRRVKASPRGVEVASEVSGRARLEARDAIRARLEDAGLTADEVVEAMRRMGPEARPADVSDELARLAGSEGRKGGTRARRQFDDIRQRDRNTGERIERNLRRESGLSNSIDDVIEDVNQRKGVGQLIFSELDRLPEVGSETLDDILQTPQVRRFLAEVAPDWQPGQKLSFKQLQQIRGMVGEMPRSAELAGKNFSREEFRRAAARLTDEMEQLFGDKFSKANRIWREAVAPERGIQAAENMVTKPPRRIRAAYEELEHVYRNEPEALARAQHGFKIELVEQIADKAGRRESGGAMRWLTEAGSDEVDKLKILFDDDTAFEAFKRSLESERKFQRLLRTIDQGSPTAPRQADDAGVAGLSKLKSMKGGDITAAVAKIAEELDNPEIRKEASFLINEILLREGNEAAEEFVRFVNWRFPRGVSALRFTQTFPMAGRFGGASGLTAESVFGSEE